MSQLLDLQTIDPGGMFPGPALGDPRLAAERSQAGDEARFTAQAIRPRQPMAPAAEVIVAEPGGLAGSQPWPLLSARWPRRRRKRQMVAGGTLRTTNFTSLASTPSLRAGIGDTGE